MSKNSATILIFGVDSMLLQTRRWILERQGYDVLTFGSLSDLERVPTDLPVKLLILCHSLTDEVCDEAIQSAELRWPGIQKLVLAATALRTYIGHRVYPIVGADGPAKLISSVNLLVGNPMPALQTHQ